MGKSGLIRTLATSDESRLPDYPDVPTLKELGHAIPYSTTDLGIGAPAKTPERVTSKLVEAYEKTNAKYGAYLKDRLLRIEQYSIHMDGKRAAENYREKERLFKEFYTQIGFKIE